MARSFVTGAESTLEGYLDKYKVSEGTLQTIMASRNPELLKQASANIENSLIEILSDLGNLRTGQLDDPFTALNLNIDSLGNQLVQLGVIRKQDVSIFSTQNTIDSFRKDYFVIINEELDRLRKTLTDIDKVLKTL